METLLRIVDESPSGERSRPTELRLVRESVTAREIIDARVREEVAIYNRERGEFFRGLVQPTQAERTVNGFRMKKRRALDPEAQVEIALEAFEHNGFFMLFDDRQIESLEERLVLTGENLVSFVRLVPLVGG